MPVAYSLLASIVNDDVTYIGNKNKLTAANLGSIDGKKSVTVFNAKADTMVGATTFVAKNARS
jgi:hypothetical protein